FQHDFLEGLRHIDSASFQAWRIARQVTYRHQIEQLQQKVASVTASPKTMMLVPAQSPVTHLNEQDLAEFRRRVHDPHYPFLTLVGTGEMGKPRLALASALQADTPLLQSILRKQTKRPRTLQAVLAGAWQVLSPAERTVLLRCSIFCNSFTLEAAIVVASATSDVLSQLAAHGFLAPESPGNWVGERQEISGEQLNGGRLHIPELVRQFAAVQLPSAVAAELQACHADYYLGLLAAWEAGEVGEQQWRDRLQPDFANLRSAWMWATDQGLVPLLTAALEGWDCLCTWTDTYLESAIHLTHTAGRLRGVAAGNSSQALPAKALLARVLRSLAMCHRALGQYTHVLQVTQEALELAMHMGDDKAELSCYFELGAAAHFQGDDTQARQMMEKGLTLAQQQSSSYWQLRYLLALGIIAREVQDHPTALAYYKTALPLLHQVANPLLEADLFNHLSMVYLALGDFVQAADCLQQYVTVNQQRGEMIQVAVATSNLGNLWLLLGDFAQAIATFRAAQQLCAALGEQRVEAACLSGLGMAFAQLDKMEAAEGYCQQAYQLAEAEDLQQTLREVRITQGHIRLRQGQVAAARAAYEQAMTLSQTLGGTEEIREVRVYRAAVLLAQGENMQALAEINAALQGFNPDGFDTFPMPAQQILLTAYQVLAANQHWWAPKILQQAWRLVQNQATKISNARLRDAFLTNVPVNRELGRLILQSQAQVLALGN
ncbi:MAG: tetratricopeptide repeat protein, partial [Chloroflexi bacterium]|nr:tetratricopeptide repeat protein [Chloroflexota bacterium]